MTVPLWYAEEKSFSKPSLGLPSSVGVAGSLRGPTTQNGAVGADHSTVHSSSSIDVTMIQEPRPEGYVQVNDVEEEEEEEGQTSATTGAPGAAAPSTTESSVTIAHAPASGPDASAANGATDTGAWGTNVDNTEDVNADAGNGAHGNSGGEATQNKIQGGEEGELEDSEDSESGPDSTAAPVGGWVFVANGSGEGVGGKTEGQGGQAGEGAGEGEEEVARRRRRLNSLVDASVSRVKEQRCNVAFIKTHKTASTTLTAVLYRYGLRHGRKVARYDVEGTAVTLEHSVEQVRSHQRR